MDEAVAVAAEGMSGNATGDNDDFTGLDDPAFLALRKRVREALQDTPDDQVDAELLARFQQLDEEFLRRARIAWTRGSQEGSE